MDGLEMEGGNSQTDKFAALPAVARYCIMGGGVAVALGILLGVRAFIRRRKNKKQQLAEEEGIEDEISGSSDDEP